VAKQQERRLPLFLKSGGNVNHLRNYSEWVRTTFSAKYESSSSPIRTMWRQLSGWPQQTTSSVKSVGLSLMERGDLMSNRGFRSKPMADYSLSASANPTSLETYFASIEEAYREEIKVAIADNCLSNECDLVSKVLDCFFRGLRRSANDLRPNFGVGRFPEGIIEFCQKLTFENRDVFRFAFEVPAGTSATSEELAVQMIKETLGYFDIDTRLEVALVRDAMHHRPGFRRNSSFVAWLGFSIADSQSWTSKLYLSLNDQNEFIALKRLHGILQISGLESLLNGVIKLLSEDTQQVFHLRAASVEYPRRASLKVYFDVREPSVGGSIQTSLVRSGLVSRDMGQKAAEMLDQIFRGVDGKRVAQPGGLGIEYMREDGSGPVLSRMGYYLPVSETSVQSNTYIGQLVQSAQRGMSSHSQKLTAGYRCKGREGCLRPSLSHLAVGITSSGERYTNIYWTLHRVQDQERSRR
jgi:hypothetical protein